MNIKTEWLAEWQATLDSIEGATDAFEVAQIIHRASGMLAMEYINDTVIECPRVTLPVWAAAGMPKAWPRPYVCLPSGINSFDVNELLRFAAWVEKTRTKG